MLICEGGGLGAAGSKPSSTPLGKEEQSSARAGSAPASPSTHASSSRTRRVARLCALGGLRSDRINESSSTTECDRVASGKRGPDPRFDRGRTLILAVP